jgi:UDP-2,4-diacetamido-2,4,6-trideoxy-beta-L-altropyranose hydrolase
MQNEQPPRPIPSRADASPRIGPSGDILFRADASPRIGTGHIMRCLTLADVLAERGHPIGFVCTPETVETVPRLARSGHALHTELPPTPAALVVVDHYGLGEDYETQAATHAAHVMVIDDLPQRRHRCDLLLDQTYGRRPDEWRPLLPASAAILTGPEHALLRPEFAKMRKAALSRRGGGPAKRLMISLGGTDPDNVTGAILTALDGSNLDLAIDVVLGAGAPHLDSIRTQITGKPVTLHVGLDTLAPLMVLADIAIGAGGTTSWERCCLGLPTITFEIADNQRDVIGHLLGAGAVVDGGPCRPLDPADFIGRLKDIALDSDRLTTVADKAARLCDGNGALRVAETITSLLSSSSRTPA